MLATREGLKYAINHIFLVTFNAKYGNKRQSRSGMSGIKKIIHDVAVK